MRTKILQYEPHRGTHPFTTVTHDNQRVQVREWDLVTSAIAEEGTEVELGKGAYERAVAANEGDERKAQRQIVTDARRRMERPIMHCLADRLRPQR
jgi:ribosomal protein S7